ncbi:hypothetical protein H6504_02810 [Candidatus Woesearchaeota archaeon]|nr:hypothetical protein [Candidatus Woesearchaeota archaeon]
MDEHSKIVIFIKMRGPTLPTELATYLKRDTVIVSAMLGELVTGGNLRMSHLMVGKSRLYYAPEHIEKLQDFSKYLNEKDLFTYNQLKEYRIIRDKAVDPLTRVSLRNIKDFAYPFVAEKDGEQQLFWRWYMLAEPEARSAVEKKEAVTKSSEPDAQAVVEAPLEETEKESEESATVTEEALSTLPVDAGVESEAVEEVKEKVIVDKGPPLKEMERTAQPLPRPVQKTLVSTDDEFASEVLGDLESRGIKVVSLEVVRKKSDAAFVIEIPTAVGDLQYYARAKKKKSVSDSDLSSAMVSAQLKKLPLVFITNGKLTKKASSMLHTDLGHITVYQLGSSNN